METSMKWLLGGGLGLSFLGIFLMMYSYEYVSKEGKIWAHSHTPIKPWWYYLGLGFLAMGYFLQLGGIIIS